MSNQFIIIDCISMILEKITDSLKPIVKVNCTHKPRVIAVNNKPQITPKIDPVYFKIIITS